MLSNGWSENGIDDLLRQTSCCCGCEIPLPSFNANNISMQHFVSYHFCSVSSKRLVGAMCSIEEDAGNLSVCRGCETKKRKENPTDNSQVQPPEKRHRGRRTFH